MSVVRKVTARRFAVVALLGSAIARAGASPAAVAAATPAAARDAAPDPAVQEAGDANLETTEHRQGMTFAIALGGGFMAGFGIDNSVGRGGHLSVRLGHVASRRTVVTLELGGTGVLHSSGTADGTYTNGDTELLIGAQYYVNPSLWLRFAGGPGVYVGHRFDPPSGMANQRFTRIGGAVLAGLGFDIARYKSAVLGFELGPTLMVNGDGVVLTGAGALGLAFD
jgi:hypothetical protein